MEVSSTNDLLDFEDPINMRPFTNVIRCPHEPCHYYQEGTLRKKNENGIEYTQCSLVNQWFISTGFTQEKLSTEAIKKLYQINKEKQILKEENELLKINIVNLTLEINKKEEHHQKVIKELNESNFKEREERKKDIEKYQNIIEQIIEDNKKTVEQLKKQNEQSQEKIEENNKEITQYCFAIKDLNKINQEVSDENKKLKLVLINGNNYRLKEKHYMIKDPQKDVLKIAIIVTSVGVVICMGAELYKKIKI